MIPRRKLKAFTLVEAVVATAVFAMMVVAIFQIVGTAQKSMQIDVAKESVEGTASNLLAQIGKDVRESSYTYIRAGDWRATKSAGVVTIANSRNYFSSAPLTSGATFAPLIFGEGWVHCPNPACTWSNNVTGLGTEAKIPHAFLSSPIRNNFQTNAPLTPPTNLSWTTSDYMGRNFGHLTINDNCPFCQTALVDGGHYSGLMCFSPRRANHSFSYGGTSGYEAQWESVVFYSMFRLNNGAYGIARYVFYASSLAAGGVTPNLINLLDFNANGVIESPPMTDQTGIFVFDADGEEFSLFNNGTANMLRFRRWTATQSFDIMIDRVTGLATVTVTGSPFAANGAQIQTEMQRFGLGISGFSVSTFVNNPSWFDGTGALVNPLGVVELGAVRVTVQIDRPGIAKKGAGMDNEETVKSTMFRPRN